MNSACELHPGVLVDAWRVTDQKGVNVQAAHRAGGDTVSDVTVISDTEAALLGAALQVQARVELSWGGARTRVALEPHPDGSFTLFVGNARGRIRAGNVPDFVCVFTNA